MAKKMSASEKKMGSNSSATQREFDLSVAPTGTALPQGTIIETDRCLSLANRRLYRQHRSYRCSLSLTNATDVQNNLPVYALANNWYVRKSLALAQEMFDYAVKEERAQVGSSRWNDFRVKPDLLAAPGLLAETLLPVYLEYSGAVKVIDYGTTGEYNYSEVEVAGAPKIFSIGQGSGATKYNIFEEFDNMGPNPPESPLGAIPGGYDLIDATFEKEEVEELLNKGNLPPYEANLVGTIPQVWTRVGTLGVNGQGDARLSTGFFDAPLGLIWIPGLIPVDTTVTPKLSLQVAAGEYKGVMSMDI